MRRSAILGLVAVFVLPGLALAQGAARGERRGFGGGPLPRGVRVIERAQERGPEAAGLMAVRRLAAKVQELEKKVDRIIEHLRRNPPQQRERARGPMARRGGQGPQRMWQHRGMTRGRMGPQARRFLQQHPRARAFAMRIRQHAGRGWGALQRGWRGHAMKMRRGAAGPVDRQGGPRGFQRGRRGPGQGACPHCGGHAVAGRARGGAATAPAAMDAKRALALRKAYAERRAAQARRSVEAAKKARAGHPRMDASAVRLAAENKRLEMEVTQLREMVKRLAKKLERLEGGT
jgi:hypothetical protein